MSKDRVFFGALALVTALPLIGLPLGVALTHDGSGAFVPGLALLIALTGDAHVASSGFFYFDREFRPLIAQNKLRFLGMLVIVPAIFVSIWALGRTAIMAQIAVSMFWLLWHYQRQNYGLIALAAASVKFGPLPRNLNLALNLAAAAGIAGTFGIADLYPPALGVGAFIPPEVHTLSRLVGLALYLASLVVLIGIFLDHPKLLRSGRVLLFLGLSWAFYAPALLSDSPLVAFSSYAIGHGAQYVIMMSVVSRRSAYGWIGLLALGAIMASLCRLLGAMQSNAVLFEIYAGIVTTHFIIDAKLWRMREPMQRAIIGRRFDFIFAPPRAAGTWASAGARLARAATSTS